MRECTNCKQNRDIVCTCWKGFFCSECYHNDPELWEPFEFEVEEEK